MRVIVDNDLFILFLNKTILNWVNFSDKEETEKYLKELLTKLNNKYNLYFEGYYDITLYIDNNYGIILEIKKEELEYLNYFSNQLEMNIKVCEGFFLYETLNIEDFMKDKVEIYIHKDKIYLKIKENISDLYLAKILEHTNIVYGKRVKEILKKAKKLRW